MTQPMPAYPMRGDRTPPPDPSPAFPQDRLIVALDVRTKAEAMGLVGDLEGLVSFFKVGYQLFLAEGMDFVRELGRQGKRVFLDLKMDDVEETIALAVEIIAGANARFLTIHGTGATAKAAHEGRGSNEYPKILSVTLLTSLDQQDLVDLGILGSLKREGRFRSLEDYVLWRAEQAMAASCDGLIAAGSSVAALREKFGKGPIIVCPGIRQQGGATDDHKRSATPRDAMAAGADYVVVGRPIRNASDRRGRAELIIEDIERGISDRH